jgi:hypothetical protein
MAGLSGPITVSRNLQLRLPIKVARALHIEAGDEFYVRISDDDPSGVVLLPAEVVERRYSAGERMEQAAGERGLELGSLGDAHPSEDTPNS